MREKQRTSKLILNESTMQECKAKQLNNQVEQPNETNQQMRAAPLGIYRQNEAPKSTSRLPKEDRKFGLMYLANMLNSNIEEHAKH